VNVPFVLKDTVPLLETSHNRSSRSMYYAKLSINDTEIERKVSLFLQSYDENCRNKTTNLAHSNSDILCSCVPPGLGKLLHGAPTLSHTCKTQSQT